jgi:hypothetical protein
MTTRFTAALAVGALLLAVGGCSSSTPDAAASAPAATESTTLVEPTPTPTPTPISREAAGAQYLALVEPVNALVAPWTAAADAGDYATMRTLAAELATQYRTFADALIAAEWPAEAQPAVDELVTELASDIQLNLQVAASTTDVEIDNLFASSPPNGGAAQKLRMLLGIDNVPVG